MTNEVTVLQQAIEQAGRRIDNALDRGDRRDFMVWCRKRACLIASVEKALFKLATAPVA